MSATSTRLTVLNSVHNYNLRNQGWPTKFACADQEEANSSTRRDPVPYTREKIGVYPSNADVIYFSKVTTANRPNAIGAYSAWQLFNYSFGNTPASRGHYILNAFNRNRQAASTIQGIYDPARDKDVDRPVAVTFYAGRVWYLMPDGRLYFSQTLTDLSKANKCYQEADPTAEDINELVATDGGLIDISGVTRGLALLVLQKELIIIADNGVWGLSGSADAGFTATDQEIRKISDVGAVGADSALVADGVVYYWADGGIYALRPDPVTGEAQAVNITETTIQTFYTDISEAGRKYCRSFFDVREKKILWMYNDTTTYSTSTTFRYNYNRILILDTVLGAFYSYSIDSSGNYPFVAGAVAKEAGTTTVATDTVQSSAVDVVDGGETVINSSTDPVVTELAVKFFSFVPSGSNYKLAVAEYNDNALVDWRSFDGTGVDYTAHAETVYDVSQDLLTEKELNQLYTFFKRTEKNFIEDAQGGIVFDFPSSCLLQGKWHWTDSSSSGRWTDQEQVYRLQRPYIVPSVPGVFDYGFDVIQTVTPVRGKGRSFSLRFESEAGKDFHLLGYATQVTGMTAP